MSYHQQAKSPFFAVKNGEILQISDSFCCNGGGRESSTWLVLRHPAVGVSLVFSTEVPAELLTEGTVVSELHGAPKVWQLICSHIWDPIKILKDNNNQGWTDNTLTWTHILTMNFSAYQFPFFFWSISYKYKIFTISGICTVIIFR